MPVLPIPPFRNFVINQKSALGRQLPAARVLMIHASGPNPNSDSGGSFAARAFPDAGLNHPHHPDPRSSSPNALLIWRSACFCCFTPTACMLNKSGNGGCGRSFFAPAPAGCRPPAHPAGSRKLALRVRTVGLPGAGLRIKCDHKANTVSGNDLRSLGSGGILKARPPRRRLLPSGCPVG